MLHRLQSQVDVDGRRNVVNVNREEVLDEARRGFRRTTFKNKCTLSVNFSREAGIDDGGPTREFMRLVLKASRGSHLFERPENGKMLAVNIAGKYIQTERIANARVHIDCGRRQRTQQNCGILAGSIGRLDDHQADGRFSCPSQSVCQPGALHS